MSEEKTVDVMVQDTMPEENYYARTVIVPIGRPDTAAQMLELAGDMVHPEHGLVIALVIALGDTEAANTVTDEVHQVIDDFRLAGDGHNVELVTQLAVSVSRGILDAARERNADVIILGVKESAHRHVKLGTVVENVIATAPCGVLIYRTSTAPSFNRVVIPTDGTIQSATAMKLGVSLALQHGATVRQMSVQYNYQYDAEHEKQMREAEALMSADKRPHKQIIVGHSPERTILREINHKDLLVMGFSQKSDFERQITDDLSNQLLNRSPGPVIMISQLEWQKGIRGAIERSILRMNPQLTKVEQNELIWNAEKSADSNLDYIVMIVLSAGLATLGLMINSVAVIIGAMLVAPLMSPISGFSTGMATGLIALTRRASLTLIVGVALALLISIGMGTVLPLDAPTQEMASRGSPTVLDAAVALVSGLVAAYALARKGIPAALAGVAIAAALMPPVCTIGLGIALQNVNLAIGSSLLFLANITFIIASQYITFLWLGVRPDKSREGISASLARVWWGLLAGLTVVVLFVFVQLGALAVDEVQVGERLASDVFVGADTVKFDVSPGVPYRAEIIVQSESGITPNQVEQAQTLMNDVYGQMVDLRVINQQIIRPNDYRYGDIETILQTALPDADIIELAINDADTLAIYATVRDTAPPSAQAIDAITLELERLTDSDVQLNIVYQQVIRAGVSGTGQGD